MTGYYRKMNLRFFISLFTFFICFTSQAQSTPFIDSLKLELNQALQDTARIQLLNQISEKYSDNYEQVDSAIVYAQLAYKEAIESEYLLGMSQGAYNLALSFDLAGKVKNALVYYEKARQHYTELGDKKWVSTCMRGKGIACYFQGDYGRSLQFYEEAVSYAQANNLKEEAASSMLNLGVIYRIIENYDRAIDLYEQNIVLQKEMEDSVTLAKVYNNLGVVYTYKNQLDSAITYLDSSIVIYTLLKDTVNLGAVYITIGDAYLEAGEDLSLARSYLKKGYAIMKVFNDNIYQSKALLYLGRVEEKTGNYSMARDYFLEGLHILEGSELDEIRRDINRELGNVQFQLGAYSDAYKRLDLSYAFNDSIMSKERLKYTEEMEVKYETEKKEREIIELNAEKTITELKLSAARKTTMILVGALVIFGLLLLGLYRLYEKIRIQRNIISKNLSEKEKLLTLLEKAQVKIIQSEKMASLGQLTAGIAHELNNPNNFIVTGTESLQTDMEELNPMLNLINELKDKNDQQKIQEIMALKDEIKLPLIQQEVSELLKGITEGVSRTSEIINGLKHFSHPGTTEKEAVDIQGSLDTILKIMYNEFKDAGTVLKQYEAIPIVPVMRNQLNQVFINLFSNAVDTIKNKFGSQAASKGKIIISTGQKEQEVYISVKDNGSGISTAEQSKIFDPFYTTKEVGNGVGLGLSISYGIIEEHGGRIELNSVLGDGSEFVVWLPVQP